MARGGRWRVCREKWPREKWLYISYTPLRGISHSEIESFFYLVNSLVSGKLRW